MATWQTLASQVGVSIIFAAGMIFLSAKLPAIFRERVKARLSRELDKQGPISGVLALELTMICADFSGSVSAILGLSLSILFEIWKLHPLNPPLIATVLAVAFFGAIGGTAKVLLLPWADKKEEEYRSGLGKRLAMIVYILSAALVVVTAIGPSIELGKKPDAVRIQKQQTSPVPGALPAKAS